MRIILLTLLITSFSTSFGYNFERRVGEEETDGGYNFSSSKRRHDFSLGFENYALNGSISGGNYVYGGYGFVLSRSTTIFTKFGTNLVPTSFDDGLVELGINYHFKISGKLRPTVGFSYQKEFSHSFHDKGFYKARISLIGRSKRSRRFELLPISLLYSPDTKKFSLAYELISIGVRF